MRQAQPGDVVLLFSVDDRKTFFRTLQPGVTLHTHNGYLAHDDLIGQPYGSLVRTHLAAGYYLLSPTTEQFIRYMHRKSQIVYPKDSGYIMLKLGVRPGSRVLEAGTGSGGMALVFASMVGESGHLYSYDVRDDLQRIAQSNLEDAGLGSRVTFKLRDAAEGFDETDIDALFLDMLTPWRMLDQARAALANGGMLGSIVPTMNQLTDMLAALNAHPGFSCVEAEELLLRPYKTAPARVRPEDRMIAHTGYLVFARGVLDPASGTLLEEQTDDAED